MIKDELVKALESKLFGAALSFNVLSVIKEQMPKSFKAFPILVYVGEPGVGKTSLVDACSICDAERLCFSDRPKTVADIIEKTDKKIVFLDDLADYKAQGIREKGFKNVDGVVRKSYDGRGPLIIMTAERKALYRQAQSCLERMICINADSALRGENMAILEWLQENKEDLLVMMQEFSRWYSQTTYDFKKLLSEHRTAYRGKGTPRQVDLAFSYYASMAVLSDFLLAYKGITLDSNIVLENIDTMIRNTHQSSIDSDINITKLLDTAIAGRKFTPQFVQPEYLCNKYLYGQCNKHSFRCDLMCDEWQYGKEEYIDPQNLIINIDAGFNSVLVQDIHQINGCLKNMPGGPVLIVDADTLSCNINDVIVHQGIVKKQELPKLSDIAIHKKLYENRQCFFLPNGYKSCRYTMNYRCYNDKMVRKTRVCFIRLTQYQLSLLEDQTQIYRTPYNEYDAKDVSGMMQAIQNFIGNLQFHEGEIGKSIYEEVQHATDANV